MKRDRIARIPRLMLALPVALALAAPAAADPGRGAGPARAEHRLLRGALRSLDLTAEQRDKVRAAFEAQRESFRALREKARADRMAVRDLLEQPNPNASAVGAAVLKAHQNRVALRKQRESARAAIEAILTPEQRAKFAGYVAAARDAFEARRGRRHRGWQN